MREAVILAGGFGTRLRGVVNDIPKPMAPIAGTPFMSFILDNLSDYGVERVILSVGYKYETVQSYFKDMYRHIDILYSVESSPLGTGGAVKKALSLVENDTVLIVNGDTYLDIDLDLFYAFHDSNGSDLTMVLKPMSDYDRYGSVYIDNGYRIVGFEEKRSKSNGLINTGVYLLDKNSFGKIALPDVFSFESDFLEKFYPTLKFYGLPMDVYFVDIGIPEDYRKAEQDLPLR
jgi:D-glycero-alpha-D-manno-heptose 1-phosphate guanylyltransferase